MPKKKKHRTAAEDRDAFISAAREMGCDESSEEFERKLKKLATVKPITNASLNKKGKKK